MSNAWTRALGIDPIDTVVDIRIQDGVVTYAYLRFPARSPFLQGLSQFRTWRDQRYPEATEIMEDLNGNAIVTDESLELWRRYTEEFVAEHSTG